MLRILTNYFQAMMIIQQFELSWPSQVQDLIGDLSIVTSSQEMIISLECIYL